ncbi:hypothetical protein [Bacillus phage PK2]|nr:hypothetical protein [Bacillus phage PK2]
MLLPKRRSSLMSEIKKLREFGSVEGSISYYGDSEFRKTVEEIEYILDGGKEVHSEFEDGGRWSNYETTVTEIREGDEVAYFRVVQERPATESQDGMDLWFSFEEVEPYEVTTVAYRSVN